MGHIKQFKYKEKDTVYFLYCDMVNRPQILKGEIIAISYIIDFTDNTEEIKYVVQTGNHRHKLKPEDLFDTRELLIENLY